MKRKIFSADDARELSGTFRLDKLFDKKVAETMDLIEQFARCGHREVEIFIWGEEKFVCEKVQIFLKKLGYEIEPMFKEFPTSKGFKVKW